MSSVPVASRRVIRAGRSSSLPAGVDRVADLGGHHLFWLRQTAEGAGAALLLARHVPGRVVEVAAVLDALVVGALEGAP